MIKRINILGTDYKIMEQSESENPKLRECLGICELYSKKIIVSDMAEEKEDVMCVENLDELRKKVLRHEIVHAFFGESGLRSSSEYAENEELVDWIAIQAPKLYKAFMEAEAM